MDIETEKPKEGSESLVVAAAVKKKYLVKRTIPAKKSSKIVSSVKSDESSKKAGRGRKKRKDVDDDDFTSAEESEVKQEEDEEDEEEEEEEDEGEEQETGGKLYTVEQILDRKKVGNTAYYLIKWKGYPISECTWEPTGNLAQCQWMVRQFNKTYTGDDGLGGEKTKQKDLHDKKKEKSTKADDKMKHGNLHRRPWRAESKKPEKSRRHNNTEEEENSVEKKETKKTLETNSGSERGSKKSKAKTKNLPKSTSPKVYEHLDLLHEGETKPAPSPAPKAPTTKTTGAGKGSEPVTSKGSFASGDVPEEVMYSHHTDTDDGTTTLYFIIRWRPRKNGFIPEPKTCDNRELREYYPIGLVDFYEKRLRFSGKKETSSAKEDKGSSIPKDRATEGEESTVS